MVSTHGLEHFLYRNARTFKKRAIFPITYFRPTLLGKTHLIGIALEGVVR
jgi:hypothetical protein